MAGSAIASAAMLAVLLAVTGSQAQADERLCKPPVAELVSALGQVDAQLARRAVWQPAVLNQGYCVEDRVRTGDLSRAVLAMMEGIATRLSLNQNTLVNFLTVSDRVILSVGYGDVHVRSHTPRHFDVTTQFVNAGIEGTEFLVSAAGDQAEVTVFEGTVQLSNPQGRLTITRGQTAVAKAGQTPRLKLLLKPHDAVQWALYYPPLIDSDALLRTVTDPGLRRAVALYRTGRIAEAFGALEQVPESERSGADYLGFKAGLLLTAGQVDQAEPLIRRALRDQPRNATAKALLAMIVLARNDKKQALSLAKEAAVLAPQSPLPLLALSYAQQARFDLEQARAAVEAALRLDPDNGLSHARHAELLASLGERAKARRAAERATELTPKLGRAHTVLGFTRLMDADAAQAARSFRRAIELDSLDPLARFGLGLAEIRTGDLEQGTEDLEIAGNLDPNDSLIRSYLGKAYYEQKRNELAETQLELAKQYDPKDPTPHFYDAIRKQTENRPGEALHDLQKAIELNDNRAIYRSRERLDEDLAARSASIGRIYQDLGFQQRGFFEGWKAVGDSPSDYSGHRLLADTYSRLPGQQIARVSELLQSQLLQPLNMTPVQPALGASNLLLLDQSGPASPSFREFNPVFARDRLSLQASGTVGSLDSYGDEVIASGISDKLSFSLGQHHFETRGYRPNNDFDQDIYNAYAQAQVTPNFGLQAELRHTNTRFGDLAQNFDLGDFSRNDRNSIRQNTARLSGTLRLTPDHIVLANFLYGKRTDRRFRKISEPFMTTDVEVTPEREGVTGEIQYIGRWNYLDTIAGLGYYSEENNGSLVRNSRISFPFTPPTDIYIRSSLDPRMTRHANAYVYNHLHLPWNLTGIVGLSADGFDTDGYDRQQINPKFGLVWNLGKDTTIRAAWLSTLKRPLLSDQTIEPTQVAGFNQFFDDDNGAKTKRYGFGIDHRLSSNLSAGVEFSWRQIEWPFFRTSAPVNINRSFEQLHRAYVYWLPTPEFAAGAEYFYQKRTENKENFGVSFDRLTTHTIPITSTYFFGNGIFARAKLNIVRQIFDDAYNFEPAASEDFALLDLAVGYRLPRRLGIISLSVNNITDERFRYFDVGSIRQDFPSASAFIPERTFWSHLLINF